MNVKEYLSSDGYVRHCFVSFYSTHRHFLRLLSSPIDFVIQADVYWHDLSTICQRGCGFISNWWLLSDITQHATAKRHSVEDES